MLEWCLENMFAFTSSLLNGQPIHIQIEQFIYLHLWNKIERNGSLAMPNQCMMKMRSFQIQF